MILRTFFLIQNFFPSKCGQVRGASDLFPPYMPSEKVEMFSNDLCRFKLYFIVTTNGIFSHFGFFALRPLELAYDSWSFVKGTSGKRYVIDSMFFANSSVNHNNWCYENGVQLPSGLYNASSCRFGAPIFMSQPHFYQVRQCFRFLFCSKLCNDSIIKTNHLCLFRLIITMRINFNQAQ